MGLPSRERLKLFYLNLGAGFLEGSLQGLGLSLGNFLLDGHGSLVNEFLGLFQTQTGVLLNSLDDLELSLASAGEDNIEFGLLCRTCCLSCCCGSCYCNCCCSGLDTIFFLQDLSEFLDIFDGEVYKFLSEFLYVCHNCKFLNCLLLFVFFFFEGLDEAGDGLTATILESADNVLQRGLEHTDDLADEFLA